MSEHHSGPKPRNPREESTNRTDSPSDTKIRDQGIDTLRGLAILLVVLFHAEHLLAEGESTVIRFINDLMQPIRMPIFAAIAGFVYGIRPVAQGDSAAYIQGKVRRLLLPMISLGLLSYVLKMAPPFFEPPTDLTNLGRVLVYPNGRFWFLEALFIVFLVIPLLERWNLLQRLSTWSSITVVGSLLFIPLQHTYDIFHGLPFAIGGAAYLFPYFILGLGLLRFSESLNTSHIRWFEYAVFVITSGVLILALLNVVPVPHHRTSLTAFLFGGSAVVLSIQSRTPVRWLTALGTYSFSIYLFHTYIIEFVNVNSPETFSPYSTAVFLFGAIAAVLIPIAIHLVIVRFRIPRFLLLGMR